MFQTVTSIKNKEVLSTVSCLLLTALVLIDGGAGLELPSNFQICVMS